MVTRRGVVRGRCVGGSSRGFAYALAGRYGTQGGGWGRDAGTVVFEERSSFNGRVSVTQHAAGKGRVWRVLRFGADTRQSVALCAPAGDEVVAQPEVLAQKYLKAIAGQTLGLLASASGDEPRRVLCLGGGGGSLPLFLAKFLPSHSVVDVVEIDGVVVKAARHCGFDSAALGSTVRVHVAAAQDFLASAADVYDAVVIDCFDAQDDIPPELLQSLELLRTCVRPDGGAVLMNTHGGQLPPLRVDEAFAAASRRLRGLGEDATSRRFRGYDADSAAGRRVVTAAEALAAALRAPCYATRVDNQGNVILSVMVGGDPRVVGVAEAALRAGAPSWCAELAAVGLHVCAEAPP